MSANFVAVGLACRCKQLQVSAEIPASSLPLGLCMCHCNTCNAATGQLCATVLVLPFEAKPLTVEGKAGSYSAAGSLYRFFCETCGTSVYEEEKKLGTSFLDTGALTRMEVEVSGKGKVPVWEMDQHIFVADAKDSGMRDWLLDMKAWEGWNGKSKEIPKGEYFGKLSAAEAGEPKSRFVSSKEELQCGCHCGGVQFTLTRPKDGSKHWSAPTQSEMAASPVPIPKTPEWWMPADGAKYNAFLCACNDCRISSGYEVSAWAIVPKANFKTSNQEVSPENVGDMQAKSTMRDHESSPGCHRQFCGRCGATLSFFTDKMPNTMNVAVGLLAAGGKTGPRVEDWLKWQTEDIGYEALAQNKSFVTSLAQGLKEWGQARAAKA